jgi:lipopolysaccharide export system protein LptA
MSTVRQPCWIFRSSAIHKAVLYTFAAFAGAEALCQPPSPSNPTSELFPDPLNPQLPPPRAIAVSPGSQESDAAGANSTGNTIGNGRTEITADETNFDPDTHIATFKNHVVLKDPTFNVVCDILVAYLKHDAPSKSGKKASRPAPVAEGPKGGTNPADDPHRTLDKAVAEMRPGGRLEITQDKVETDGTITHSIGHGSKAVYNAITGTTVLTGMPDATKGADTVVATDEKTVITLTRDGGMSTVGPHKVVIIDKNSLPGVKHAPPP